MQIIIPMSGVGQRFIDAGYSVPKPLIIVEGKPIVCHIIDLFDKQDHFTFICNNKHLEETNMRQILLDKIPNCRIIGIPNHQKGPVYAVLQASEFIHNEEQVIISYCDFGTEWDYKEFKNKVNPKDVYGAIPCYTGFHPHMLGSDNYAFVKETNLVLEQIQEKKPFTENKMNEYASNGIYYFKNGLILKHYFSKLMELDIHLNGEYYVSMVYNLLKNDNLKTIVYPINKMLQWGTPKDLEEYLMWSDYFLKRDPNFNQLNNRLFLQDTALILPMAGKGSRFAVQGYHLPKPFLDIEGQPMFIQAVKCLPETNKKIFIYQIDHLQYNINKHLQTNFTNVVTLDIDYITEGQACTCSLAIKNFNIQDDESILISACDNGAYYQIDKYNELVEDDNVDVIVWSFSNNKTSQLYPQMYAWLNVDKNNIIRRVSIKKPFEDVENKYAIIGTMLFKKASYFNYGLKMIQELDIRTNGEYYVDNVIEYLVNNKICTCKIFNVDNYLCWGTPNDYKTYNYWFEYFYKLQK